jgi:hypothetical protein
MEDRLSVAAGVVFLREECGNVCLDILDALAVPIDRRDVFDDEPPQPTELIGRLECRDGLNASFLGLDCQLAVELFQISLQGALCAQCLVRHGYKSRDSSEVYCNKNQINETDDNQMVKG